MIFILDTLAWIKQDIRIQFMVGEVIIGKYICKGIRCHPDMFEIPQLSLLHPPLKSMCNENVEVAYLYSCPISTDLSRVSIHNKYVCVVDSVYRHYYVKTKGSFDQYLSVKNKKTVSTLMRKVRKIENLSKGGGCFEVYSSATELDEFLTLAIPISEKSYQQRLLGQGLPKTQQFRDDVLAKGSRGEMLGYILKIGDEPVAYNLCPRYGGGNRVLYDYTGYNPDFSNYSPGTVLQFKTIEDLFGREGVDYYDLCTGEGAHKNMFSTGFIRCGNIYFFSITIKHLSIFIFKAALVMVTFCAKQLLERVGFKARVKNFIRRFA